MIINNVPYIEDKKEKYASCQGPPTVMMALRFFLPKLSISFDELYEKMNYKKGNWFFEMYMVKLFDDLSIPSIYYSTQKIKKCTSKKCFEEISGLDFYNNTHRTEFNLEHYNSSIDFVLKHNLFKQVKNLSIDFIKKQISDSKLVIATINRNKIIDKKGYKGHFILIKGFKEDSFICNDAFLGENLSVTFDKFLEAFYYVNWEKPNDKNEYVKDIVVIG